jgi:hypothetical protein
MASHWRRRQQCATELAGECHSVFTCQTIPSPTACLTCHRAGESGSSSPRLQAISALPSLARACGCLRAGPVRPPAWVRAIASRSAYRSGDLTVLGKGGLLRLLGRADHVVMLRGHRFGLAEIEAAIGASRYCAAFRCCRPARWTARHCNVRWLPTDARTLKNRRAVHPPGAGRRSSIAAVMPENRPDKRPVTSSIRSADCPDRPSPSPAYRPSRR